MKNLLIKIINRLTKTYDKWKRRKAWEKINLNLDPNEALIISGDPRGGTTWLAEIISTLPKTEMMWEPLWIEKEETFRKLNFSNRQYLPENFIHEEVISAFSNLFKGNIVNNHIGLFTSPSRIINSQRLLFKFCRANQLLPYLTKNFDFKYPPLYIVRHPCAVISSQLNQGGWDHISSVFEIPYRNLFPEFYLRHERFLKSINNKTKKLAAIWCLCNSIPLNHQNNNIKWITICYENLIMNGEVELNKIEKRWKTKLPKEAFQRLNFASKTTINASPIKTGDGSQISHWNEKLTNQQKDDIMEVLDYFEINLYGRSPFPQITFS